MTKAGFTWFTTNYRLAPTKRWPACAEDLEGAIRWVKANAKEYKADPKRIARGQQLAVAFRSGGLLNTGALTGIN